MRDQEDLLYEKLRSAIKLEHDTKLAMIKADYEDMPKCYEDFRAASTNMAHAIIALSLFMDKLVSVGETGIIDIRDRGGLN